MGDSAENNSFRKGNNFQSLTRYLNGKAKKEALENAHSAYFESSDLASNLKPYHPLRLSIAWNVSGNLE
jgi:hypothetical protein